VNYILCVSWDATIDRRSHTTRVKSIHCLTVERVRGLDESEHRIHNMVESFVSLRSQLDDQSGGMRTSLKEQGIYLPAPETREVDTTEKSPSLDESTHISESQGDNTDDEFDVLSAAQAATNALQLD
jgi:hypothetical protein